MKRTVLVQIVLLALGFPARGGSIAPQAESIDAKWIVDLRAAVGGVPLGLVVGRGHETLSQPSASLRFLDNQVIVATFVTREGESSLSSRDASNASSPLRLRAVFLDAEAGKITATPAWPSESRFAGIVSSHEGKFIAQTGNTLTLYSSDLKELKALKLPPTEEIGWGAHASPTGKHILFIASNLRTTSAVPWILIDSGSLQILRSWKEAQSGWVGVSDSDIAMTSCVWLYDCEPMVQVRGFDAGWKMLASASRHYKPRPEFVNDDLLFLFGNPARLIRTNGTTLFAEEVSSERCWWGGVYPSAGGQRFVVPSCKSKGRVGSLDLGGRDELQAILVYDAPFHGKSYVLNIKEPKIKDFTLLALSPDGSKLAVLNGESVWVFRLPPLLKQ